MKSDRKPRKKISKKNLDFSQPLKIDEYGTDKDPCFGKLHDLKAAECKRCGDAEICSIVFSQKIQITRNLLEESGNFKDLHEPLNHKETKKIIIKLIRVKHKKGLSPERIGKIIKIRYAIPLKDSKSLIEEIIKNI